MAFVSHFIEQVQQIVQVDMAFVLVLLQHEFVILFAHIIVGDTQYQAAAACGSDEMCIRDRVKTKAVKLEIVQPADNSSGLFEWEVK